MFEVMKKDLAKYFAAYEYIDVTIHNVPEDPPYVPSDDELTRIIKEIFTLDEITGLPIGDLQYYMSKEGNPQVKQWLENNLLSPRAQAGQKPEELTDDLIVECSRRADESVQQYGDRLRQIYDDAVNQINSLKSVNNE